MKNIKNPPCLRGSVVNERAVNERYVGVDQVLAMTGLSRDELIAEMVAQRFPVVRPGSMQWARLSVELYLRGRTPGGRQDAGVTAEGTS